jgi:uncharacterized protein YlxP (DUF503 family)
MRLAVIRVELIILMAKSLKDRRQGIEPIKAKVARLAHYAIAEENDELLWNHAVLWFSVLAPTASLLQTRVEALREILDSSFNIEVLEFKKRDDYSLGEE